MLKKIKDYCMLWCIKYTNLDYKILKSIAYRHQKFSKLLRR